MYITFFTCYVHFLSQKLFFLFPSPLEKVPVRAEEVRRGVRGEV